MGLAVSHMLYFCLHGAKKRLLLTHAWYTTTSGSNLLEAMKVSDKIVVGANLGTSTNDIACSLQCDNLRIRRLRKAVERMEKDGTSHWIRAGCTSP